MIFSRFVGGLLAAMALLVLVAQPASAQYGDVQREIINNTIQNIIQSVRDEIQHRRLATPVRRLPFSGEDAEFNNRDPFTARGQSYPFAALAYTKAPPMAPVTSQWLYGANLIGSGDQSYTFGTRIDTQTVTGAFDVTKIGIFTATDALTFIGTGSNSWSHSFTGVRPCRRLFVRTRRPQRRPARSLISMEASPPILPALRAGSAIRRIWLSLHRPIAARSA